MPDEKRNIRIFIGSPSDVNTEREIAYKVVSYLHDLFQTISNHYRIYTPTLQAVGWESVLPNAGIANNIILNKYPPTQNDIFIFILWKRFGCPPGIHRRDGKRYESGTQEEFEKAYEVFQQNKINPPVIMVYRKMDDFSITSLERKDVKQYNKLLDFFEECNPGGKHPTFFYTFKADEFETKLREHIVEAVLSFTVEKDNKGEEVGSSTSSPVEPSSSKGETHYDALTEWLRKSKLIDNPFSQHVAENEKDSAKYYVPSTGLSLLSSEIVQSKKNWIFFGMEGSGKTALRKFISSNCAPEKPTSKILAITYETKDLRGFLLESVNIEDALSKISNKILRSALKFSGTLDKYEEEMGRFKISDIKDPTLILQQLNGELLGFDYLACLLDVASISNQTTTKLVEFLALLATIETEKVGFRLFIPNNLKNRFKMQGNYLGKCDLRELKWEEKDLKALIAKRLGYYSVNKTNPVNELAPLCEPKGKMKSIDDEIIRLSEGIPRAVVWLANELVLMHCQNESNLQLIRSQSWEKVQLKWMKEDRIHVLGPSGATDTFFATGSEIYFRNSDRPLKLSKRSKLLLKPIVDADGQICTKDELIRSAWPGVNRDGVTDAAVREAIRRLKVELEEKNKIDSTWINTIHGQGYQLLDPQENISIGGNATNSVIVQGDNNQINLSVSGRAKAKEDA